MAKTTRTDAAPVTDEGEGTLSLLLEPETIGEGDEGVQDQADDLRLVNPDAEADDIAEDEGADAADYLQRNLAPPKQQGQSGKGKGKAEPTGEADPDQLPSEERWRYWQSVADKRNNRIQELEMVQPIADLLAQDHELVDVIQQHIQKKRGGPEPAAVPQEAKLERPTRPVRPATYDEVAAVNDPQSESYKYREAILGYQEQLAEYMEKRDAANEQRMEQARQQREFQEKQAQQVAQLRVQLNQQGLKPEEQEAFVQMFSNPNGYTLADLVALFRMKNSPKRDPKLDQRAKDLLNRQKRQDMPLPLGVEGGESQTEPEMTEEEEFNMALLRAGGRRKKG